MEDTSTCPNCHTAVRYTDYFCYNCGANIKPSPPSTSLTSQVILYTKSILLPPFGLLWSLKYLGQKDNKSKIVGLTAIILTVLSLLITIKMFTDFTSEINKQLDSSVSNIYGF